MIQMPRRSVTRFFIPLIDVLLLTFGVFLLMPIAAETELDQQRQEAAEKGEAAAGLEQKLNISIEELYKLEALLPDLERAEALKKENDLLRSVAHQSLQQTLTVRVIKTNPKTGAIFWYDPARAEGEQEVPIPDAKTARALIAQHKQEAMGRSVYYHFLRQRGPRPTEKQDREYRGWFKDVPNSLEVPP
jgi:hypothetical protein